MTELPTWLMQLIGVGFSALVTLKLQKIVKGNEELSSQQKGTNARLDTLNGSVQDLKRESISQQSEIEVLQKRNV